MKAVCEALGVSRSNIAAGFQAAPAKPLKRVGRPAKPDDNLVKDIKMNLPLKNVSQGR